jgi:hypothetical protein
MNIGTVSTASKSIMAKKKNDVQDRFLRLDLLKFDSFSISFILWTKREGKWCMFWSIYGQAPKTPSKLIRGSLPSGI